MSTAGDQDAYFQKNETMRIELFKTIEGNMVAPVMGFFRTIGLPHIYWELILPALAEGEGLVCAAVKDRPWPPWGIGAQHVHALMLVYPLTEHGAGLNNIFILDEDLGNVGLAAAVYKEALGYLIRKNVYEVSYVVMEGSVLASRTLNGLGFKKTDELFMTQRTRYFIHTADVKEHCSLLGLDAVETPDLLAHQIEDASFGRFTQWLAATTMGTAPLWNGRAPKPEIIPNTGGALRSSKPGGANRQSRPQVEP